jgi:hypothetical protein
LISSLLTLPLDNSDTSEIILRKKMYNILEDTTNISRVLGGNFGNYSTKKSVGRELIEFKTHRHHAQPCTKLAEWLS